MLSRIEAVEFLRDKPYKFGHLLGFTKLIPMHNAWIRNMAFGTKDYTLQGHRNSYKTTCLSISLALIMIFFPNKRILFMRKTDDDVKEIIKQVKNILLNPKTIYLVFCIYGITLKLTVENATELSTNLTTDIKGTSQLVGIGIGSSITGKHFDYIFTDDIVNIKDRVSRAERERTKVAFQELENIKMQGGKIFNTGTPWHKEDCFTLMPKPEKWDCYSTGIFSKEELDAKKGKMTASLFAANYELRHIASEDIIFNDPQTGAKIDNVLNANYCHIDAAYGGADYTAFTICKKIQGKYYVYGRLWQKAVDDCVEQIIAERKRLLVGKIYCETNGDKGYLAKSLREKGERVVTYSENTNKFIKIVTHLKGEWENVVFVEGTDEEYINQIIDYNEFAEHDDAPDSLACMIRILHPRHDDNKHDSGFGYNSPSKVSFFGA